MYLNYIWATDRMSYMKNKKKMQPYKGCIFCGVAKGKLGVINKVIYKDKMAMVILNVFPYNRGHVQVIPIRHVEALEDLKDEERDHLFKLVARSIKMVKKAFEPKGFNLGMNIGGELTGASIKHIHVQVVPRYKRDLGFMEVTGSTKVMPITLDQVQKKLKKYAYLLKGDK